MRINSKVVLLPVGHVLLPGMVMRMRTDAMSSLPELNDDERAALAEFRLGDAAVVSILPRKLNKEPAGVATLARVAETSQGVVTVRGLCRVLVDKIDAQTSCGLVKVVPSSELKASDIEELRQALQTLLQPLGAAGSLIARRFSTLSEGLTNQSAVIDVVATMLPLKTQDKLDLLLEFDAGARAKRLVEIVRAQAKRSGGASDSSKLGALVPQSPKLTAARARDDHEDDEVAQLEKELAAANLPEDGRRIVNRELRKLKRTSPQQAEYNVMRSYLEVVADIPWSSNQVPELSSEIIRETSAALDGDHYGLEKPKKRLLEYLAVLYLQQKKAREGAQSGAPPSDGPPSDPSKGAPRSPTRSPILCLVGPPGVGKTSLAQSIARALERPLQRISLGGVRDEAEIRGHRKTYIGAMPGILVQGLRKARSMNPVFVLDEIDKVGQGAHSAHGDPSAALLEVLDPEQNSTFVDHYIGFPVDLSNVLFIATANSLENMPRPLLDRMEVIHIDGYTYLEKQHIAQNYLLPKQIKQNALDPADIVVPNSVIDYIATRYTRESGVRNLERRLGTLCRGRAVELLNHADYSVEISRDAVPKYLGLELFHDDVVNDEVDVITSGSSPNAVRSTPGLVNGLAYMGSGTGGLLVFEASLIPGGSGKLKTTGKLGDVISESAQIAFSWVRAHAAELGSAVDISKNDFHLHAPAGAIPKDGPSAGVAMTVCLVSLICRLQVPRDCAMTGEITLRGKILPVGGVREKLLGAHMAGVRQVLLPWHCRSVVEDECQFVKELDLEVVYVKYIWDVFAVIWPRYSQLREPASL